ncbi:MAG TPA: hypothetical protein VMC03_03410 [Streptosporangiaceae bacterium]|nr:hypothetical protein [Streptosporangiaceae bacterium]
MKRFRYRALVTLDPPGPCGLGWQYPSGTRALMVRARRIGEPPVHRYMPATISPDDQLPLRPGDQVVATITVIDDEAPAFLGPGQPFTLWGGSTGHGIISREVFTDSGPS